MSPSGIFVTHATSPYYTPRAFWSIEKTIKSSGFDHVIPSFGEWGFVMASLDAIKKETTITVPTRFLNDDLWPGMKVFSQDMKAREVAVNEINKPILLQYYLEGWQNYR